MSPRRSTSAICRECTLPRSRSSRLPGCTPANAAAAWLPALPIAPRCAPCAWVWKSRRFCKNSTRNSLTSPSCSRSLEILIPSSNCSPAWLPKKSSPAGRTASVLSSKSAGSISSINSIFSNCDRVLLVMRIVSLLPSATEILFALGLEREIVGVSHECDFPPRSRAKPVVIHSRMPHDAAPAEIDRLVSEYVHRGESLYAVDAEMLESLAPDLIVTQDLCHVCAASPDDWGTALARFDRRPEVLCLNPQDLGDVWRDILWVGEEACRGPQAEALVKEIGARLGALEQAVSQSTGRPRVAFLEWLQPFYVGGHWVPEMIQVAGGEDVLGKNRTPSFPVHLQDIVEAEPEILLIAPCGYRAQQARIEYLSLEFPEQWNVT